MSLILLNVITFYRTRTVQVRYSGRNVRSHLESVAASFSEY